MNICFPKRSKQSVVVYGDGRFAHDRALEALDGERFREAARRARIRRVCREIPHLAYSPEIGPVGDLAASGVSDFVDSFRSQNRFRGVSD